jgi:hypothetical protein
MQKDIMFKMRKLNGLVSGLVLLLTLCALPNLAFADDSDTVNVSVEVPVYMLVYLSEDTGENPSTDMAAETWNVTVEQMLNETVYNPSGHEGYIHMWGNVDVSVDIERTDTSGVFSEDAGATDDPGDDGPGLHLYCKADGDDYKHVTPEPVYFTGSSSPHSNDSFNIKITGLNWATPMGTHTETITVTIFEDEGDPTEGM